MKRFLLLPILLMSLLVFGQTEKPTSTLQGKIIDGKTSERLPFVNVVLEQNGVMVSGAQTDFDGKYVIKPIPPGTYTLRVSYLGYESKILNGIVTENEMTKTLDINMSDRSVQIISCCICYCYIPLIDADTAIDLFAEQKKLNDSLDAVSPITGFESNPFTAKFLAFPNPTNGMMTLTNMPNTDEMLLIDMTGKIIRTIYVVDELPITIDFTSLQSGMYFLKYAENGQQKTMKLMRQ